MSDTPKRSSRKFSDVCNLACQIATKKAAGKVVLVSRRINEGIAINCRPEGGGTLELRLYIRADNNIFLVQKLGEEVRVGTLNDDDVQHQVAEAIISRLPS